VLKKTLEMASFAELSRDEYLRLQTEAFDAELAKREAQRASFADYANRIALSTRRREFASLPPDTDYASVFSQLPEHEQQELTVLHRRYSSDIDSLILSPNADASTLGGHLLIMNPEARIQLHDAVGSESPFGCTILVPITSDNPISNSEEFSRQFAAIIESLPTDGPTYAEHYSSASGSPYDSQSWRTFFPSHNASIGIYHRDDHYFLIGTAHAGHRILPEIEAMLAESGMTASRFVQDHRVRWMADMAKRNLQRALYFVASKFGWTCSYHEDLNAFVPMHHARPRCAVPHIITRFNVPRLSDCKQHALFYRDCADAKDTPVMLVQSDPEVGYGELRRISHPDYHLYHMGPIKTTHKLIKLLTQKMQRKFSRRRCSHGGAPVTSLRFQPLAEADYGHLKDVMGVDSRISSMYDTVLVYYRE
jgi:hypothetical protein